MNSQWQQVCQRIERDGSERERATVPKAAGLKAESRLGAFAQCVLPNRLAAEGEELVAHRFLTSTIGFTSLQEAQAIAEARGAQKRSGFWAAIKSLFSVETGPSATAVCIPPGARLSLQDMPERLQSEFDVGPNEEVTFTQLTAQPYAYRDAIRFNNGREVLLQKLEPGQRAVVLRLALAEEVAEPETAYAAVS
jgi:hypothetical protein